MQIKFNRFRKYKGKFWNMSVKAGNTEMKEEIYKANEIHIINTMARKVIQMAVSDERKRLNMKFKFPATKEDANKHQSAMSFGYHERQQNQLYCLCCSQPIMKEKVPLCEPTTPIAQTSSTIKINSSVCLFFTFIKSLLFYFLMHFAILDGFNLTTNILYGDNCSGHCSQQLYSHASILHKTNRKDLVHNTDILCLVIVVLSIVHFVFYRSIQYQIYCTIDNENLTEDDYTIFVHNIPVLNFPPHFSHKCDFPYEKDLHALFSGEVQEWLQRETFNTKSRGTLEYDYYHNIVKGEQLHIPKDIVKSITLCYDVNEISTIKKLRTELMKKHQEEMKNDPNNLSIDEDECNYQGKVSFLNQAQIDLCRKYLEHEDPLFKLTHFIGCAFVSLKYQHYRDYIVRMFEKNSSHFMLNDSPLNIQLATDPTDVIWSNLKLPAYLRLIRQVTSNIILFIILLFSFGLLLGTNFVKEFLEGLTEENKGENNWGGKVVSVGATLITLLINEVLSLVVYAFVKWEKHQTLAKEKFGLVFKLAISQFLNTALIYYIISVLNSETNDELLSGSGLVYQISTLITTSGIIQILVNLVYPSHIMKVVRNYLQYPRDEEEVPEYQLHFNRHYQLPEFDIAARYGYYLLQLYTVSFYAYLVPVTVPAIILTLFFQYWVDKLNLFRRSSLYYEMHYSLSSGIAKMAQLSVLVFAGGAAFFSFKIHGYVPVTILISLIIALAYFIVVVLLPDRWEKRILLQNYETRQVETYDYCREQGKFFNRFWNNNPVTKLFEETMVSARNGKGQPDESKNMTRLKSHGTNISEQLSEQENL